MKCSMPRDVPGKFLCLALLCFFASLHTSAQLKANFNASVTQGCSPLVVNFSDASTGNPTSWFWNLGNGATSVDAMPGAIYITPGQYTVTLTVKNSSGADSITKKITVYADPVISFSADPLIGCAPLNVSFKDNSTPGSGTKTNWLWDFGDGTGSADQNPNHTYNISDTFNVTLTVTNSFQCKQTLQTKNLVKIGGLVTTSFNYNYTNICNLPASVAFINSSGSNSPLTYKWFFGDGSGSTKNNPVYTYNSAGNYIVKLIATNADGCSNAYEENITIGSAKANFTYTGGCSNQPVIFTDSSSSTPINETWIFDDGTKDTGRTVSHTFRGNGPFNVKLIADFGGCTNTIVKSISTAQKPHAKFTVVDGNIKTCTYPVTIKFSNQSLGAVNYQWLFGDGSTSDSINAGHTYNLKGSYSVSLIAFNSNGCTDTLNRPDLVQLGPPKILGIDSLPFTGCVPKKTIFHPTIFAPDPITSYRWNFGDGNTSTDSIPSHLYSKIGLYNVMLVIATAKGCSDSVTFTNAVSVGNRPKANFSATPAVSCAGDSIQFKDHSTGIITDWQWIFGDNGSSSEQNPAYYYTDTGYFNVSLIVSEYGCADTLTKNNYVYLKPPVAGFHYLTRCDNPYQIKFEDNSVAPKTWLWNFGDGSTAADSVVRHTYTDTGVYYISLKVTNGACSSTMHDTIAVVAESPVFNYKSLHTNFCKYDTLQFFASHYNPANIQSFYWDFSDGNFAGFGSGLDSVYYYYQQAGSYTPLLIARDIHNCDDTISKPLRLNIYGPKATFATLTGGCIFKPINFLDASSSDGTHPIVQWIWNYGDSTKPDTLTAPPFMHNYSQTGLHNVSLKIKDSNGCYDSVINMQAADVTHPLAKFFTDTLSCSGNVLKFSDSSSGNTLIYNWNFGDGGTSVNAEPEYAYTAQGSFDVRLVVTNKYGCTDTLSKPQYVRVINPVASFNLADTLFTCPPASVSPQNTSQNFTSLLWDFGDGNTSTDTIPFHSYTAAGVYNLKLIAKGNGNCYDTLYKQMVLKGPQGKLSYDSAGGCNPHTVSLSVTSKNTIQYIWDFGNGITENTDDSSINYTYASTGRFLPQLIIVDSGGCKVPVVNYDTIVVYGADALFTQQPLSNFCDSLNIGFTDSSSAYLDNIQKYNWNFADGDSTTLQNPSHVYHASNLYLPVLTVTTSRGCVSTYTDSLNIVISNTPNITALMPDSSCVLSLINYSASLNNTQPNVAWLWNFGTDDTSHNQNPSFAYNAAGVFPVSLIATNADGCADTIKKTITINPLPVIYAGADSIICLGQSTILNATGAQTYMWSSNTSLSCIDCKNPVAKPSGTTTYFVTGKNQFGCVASDSVLITVKVPAKVLLSAPDNICVGSTITLNASGEEVYNWQPVNLVSLSSGPQTSSTPASTTKYSVIGSDSKGCFYDTAFKTVHVFPYPSVQIADTSVTILNGSNYQVNAIGSDDIVSWLWSPVTGLSCIDCGNPLASPIITTTYTVTAKNITGCTTQDKITITVLCKNQNMFIPNTFSPNNDGTNDYFYPRGKGFTVKSFRIFNRWGNIVFEQHNFPPNSQSYGWDGKYKGKVLQPDVFVFLIDIICDNGDVITTKGNVTLLR